MDQAVAEEAIRTFMREFHEVGNLGHWNKIRRLMRVDVIATFTFKINDKTGDVSLRASRASEEAVDLAAARVRKFLLSGEPTFLPKSLEHARHLGIWNERLEEAESQLNQTMEERFTFIVDPSTGKSVGTHIPGVEDPIRWLGVKDLSDPGLLLKKVSTRDAVDVFYNEGFLHAADPKRGRNEEKRAILRSAPKVYRQALANTAIAATVYAAGLTHMAIYDHKDPRWTCGYHCQEARILEELRAQHRRQSK